MTQSLVINLDDLKAEVKQLLAESATDRLVPDPILRIGQIVETMRRYKAAIVAANAPRGFEAGTEVDPTLREMLRIHRLAAFEDDHPDKGIRPLKDWLLSLNTDFVLQGQPFRVNDADWTSLIWNPLVQWASHGVDLLFSDTEKNGWPSCLILPVLKAWEDDELELEYELFSRMTDFLPEGEWPRVDLQNGILRWDSRETKLISPRDLRIVQCLANKKGRYVDDDDICETIDAPRMSGTTFRQTISRLRRKLTKADFGDIAEAIVRDTANGRMCLDHNRLLEELSERHSTGK